MDYFVPIAAGLFLLGPRPAHGLTPEAIAEINRSADQLVGKLSNRLNSWTVRSDQITTGPQTAQARNAQTQTLAQNVSREMDHLQREQDSEVARISAQHQASAVDVRQVYEARMRSSFAPLAPALVELLSFLRGRLAASTDPALSDALTQAILSLRLFADNLDSTPPCGSLHLA